MNILYPLFGLLGLFGIVFVGALLRSIRIVPARTALVVERLGKYSRTLQAGFHVLFPFIDRVRYKHNLKEQAVDVPAQFCFTQDNVQVKVDGVLYMQVVDAKRASYGIRDQRYATIQLAQTTMRSLIGKLELDKTFEEREQINGSVVKSVDEASDPWGVRVSRYEIQNITVPQPILQAMEIQMKAEREKRALIAKSIGTMESNINSSMASMEEAINESEGQKERLINEAEGVAAEILAIAKATADGIKKVAAAVKNPGGEEAVFLRVAENYVHELSKLARKNTNVIIPMDLTDISNVADKIKKLVKE
ncbi:MAG: paraslipin [Spirochaetales bacterium]|nr:paraslipin [Spirochaetales bacterium]